MRIKEIRKERGVSQTQAARDLNLTQVTYNRYENGLREPPSVVLIAMADYFHVTVDEILGRPAPDVAHEQENDEVATMREQLRRSPDTRLLFDAARKATPEHIRAAAAMLKALEPKEDDL